MRTMMISLLSLFLLLSLGLTNCEKSKAGFFDKERVRADLNMANERLDAAINLAKKGSLTEDEKERLRGLIAEVEDAKQNATKGLSEDVGNGLSFYEVYILLHYMDKKILQAKDHVSNCIEKKLDISKDEIIKKLEEAKEYKKELEGDFGFSD